MPGEVKMGALYRHYKTKGLYMPLQLVKNTGDGQNDQLMALYYSFSARDLFVRPLVEWVASVPDGSSKILVPRFDLAGLIDLVNQK